MAELGRQGAHVLDAESTDRIRAACYPEGRINTALAGKDAAALAAAARDPGAVAARGCWSRRSRSSSPRSRSRTRSCSRCWAWSACPTPRAASTRRGPCCASAGAGHSAVIHSRSPQTILAYGAALRVLRVSVNAPGSTGSAGLDTHLAPTMTIGTGFFGRSSLTENLQPARSRAVDAGGLCVGSQPSRSATSPGSSRGRRPLSARHRCPRHRCPRRLRQSTTGLSREELRELILAGAARGGAPLMAELRSSIFIDQLQPQTMCYLGTWVRGRLPRTRMAAGVIEIAPGSTSSRSPTSCSSTPRRRPASSSSSASSAIWSFTRARPPRCESASEAVLDALGAVPSDATRADDPGRQADLAPGPPARVPDQPQQARLDGAGRRVAVRARDAARLLRHPGHQRGREGRADQGRRLPHDRRHRPRVPDRRRGRRAHRRRGGDRRAAGAR